MKSRFWVQCLGCGVLMVLVIPAVCRAQLSSTNYQVQVFGVGEEGGGTATSSQYRVNGVIGTTLQRTPVSPSADVSYDGNNTSGSPTRNSAGSQSVPSAISPMITSPEQAATEPRDDQVRASSSGMSISQALYDDKNPTTEAPSLSQEDGSKGRVVESDETVAAGEGGGLLKYWWMMVVIVLGIFYWYKKKFRPTGL